MYVLNVIVSHWTDSRNKHPDENNSSTLHINCDGFLVYQLLQSHIYWRRGQKRIHYSGTYCIIDICYYIIYIVSLSYIHLCVFQGTSVLSPVLHIGSVIVLAMMIYKKSAVQLFQKHPCLYILAFGFVSAKITNKLVVSKDAHRHGLGF